MPRRSGRPDVQACRGGCARRENQTSSWKPKAHPGRPRAKPISRSRRRFFLAAHRRASDPPGMKTGRLPRPVFFLGRQSWLAEELFEPAEVGGGIAAEL